MKFAPAASARERSTLRSSTSEARGPRDHLRGRRRNWKRPPTLKRRCANRHSESRGEPPRNLSRRRSNESSLPHPLARLHGERRRPGDDGRACILSKRLRAALRDRKRSALRCAGLAPSGASGEPARGGARSPRRTSWRRVDAAVEGNSVRRSIGPLSRAATTQAARGRPVRFKQESVASARRPDRAEGSFDQPPMYSVLTAPLRTAARASARTTLASSNFGVAFATAAAPP